jgi:N-acetylmuramoyl-L-alanine amidase
MSKKIFILDPGHGGMIDGQYQTAPKKMFQHDNGEIAYEGVINRNVVNFAMDLFKRDGIPAINLCPTELDIELDERVDIANTYCREYGNHNVLGISTRTDKIGYV